MSTIILDVTYISALYHDAVHLFGTSWRWGKTISIVYFPHNMCVHTGFKRFMSKTPYFIHDNTKTPHITCSGEILIMNCL